MESIKYFYANASTAAAAETSSCIVYVVVEVSHKKWKEGEQRKGKREYDVNGKNGGGDGRGDILIQMMLKEFAHTALHAAKKRTSQGRDSAFPWE